MGIFKSIKNSFNKIDNQGGNAPATESYPTGNAIVPPRVLSPADVYRFRKQRGVNLGSWFVLEKWITWSPYNHAKSPAQSDHDVARGGNAQQIMEHHYENWIKESDFEWLSQLGINTVRIPIGYYHFSKYLGDNYLDGTDFEGLGHVYQNTINYIERAVDWAEKYNLGVHFDLHSAPGKQNHDDHSGRSGPAIKMWKSRNIEVLKEVLRFLVGHFHQRDNVVAIELINEPANNDQLQSLYLDLLGQIRTITHPHFPIAIGDAWDTNWYAQLAGGRKDFVILDHHLYRCFTEDQISSSSYDHAGRCKAEYLEFLQDAKMKARDSLIIGEWSAGLNPRSMLGGNHDEQRAIWARAQLELYEKTAAGWFWWTLRKEHGGDSGWDFKEAIRTNTLPHWLGGKQGLPAEGLATLEERDAKCDEATGQHAGYWETQNIPAREHWRFVDGFKQGWDDAVMFAYHRPGTGHVVGRSEIGFFGKWIEARMDEHFAYRGGSNNIWEFEHAFAVSIHDDKRTPVYISLEDQYEVNLEQRLNKFEADKNEIEALIKRLVIALEDGGDNEADEENKRGLDLDVKTDKEEITSKHNYGAWK
ncbi:glycoside hydrolase [Wallemia mellicola]|uniref:Glycoside hydrolase n=1 Tax=Wallemia mellicola TaxID=1708541 RepID=A0A4T0NQY7_9BASI|nr:hypothetical protein E3Q23_01025 [Wallemia mellicola]TIB99790.1 glycoside hydrolase [Wallemia mellicola]TIC14722.1 glycoside hydrolase [Wallemia mellicola]TIC29712.1 glycoside hydrolase [Wallemia mellicola]TIC68263.1 glycoside hydrolase [Wallemia mellicola]